MAEKLDEKELTTFKEMLRLIPSRLMLWLSCRNYKGGRMDPNTQLKLWRAMKPVRDRIIEELYERSQDFLDDLLKFVDGDEGARAYLKGEVGTRLAIASIYFEKISNELHAAYKQCEECLHIQDPTQEQLNKKIFKMKYHLREMLMERALVPHWVN